MLCSFKNPETMPQIIIAALTDAGAPSSSMLDLALPGSSFAPPQNIEMIQDPLTTVLQGGEISQGIGNGVGTVVNRAVPKRRVVHAAISRPHSSLDVPAREGSSGADANGPTSMLLIALKSRPVPLPIRPTSILGPANASYGQSTSNNGDATDLDTTGGLNDPNNPAKDPMAQNANATTSTVVSSDPGSHLPGTAARNGPPQQMSQPSLTSRMFEDGYGDINMSALDELFDFDGGLGAQGGTTGNGNLFGSTSSSEQFSSAPATTTNNASSGAGNAFETTPAASGSLHSSPAKESPTKSVTNSPLKMSREINGNGVGVHSPGELHHTATDPKDEILPSQEDGSDEERGLVHIWELSIHWSALCGSGLWRCLVSVLSRRYTDPGPPHLALG